jgi:hypothetical protein
MNALLAEVAWTADSVVRIEDTRELLVCAWTGFLDRGPKPGFNL